MKRENNNVNRSEVEKLSVNLDTNDLLKRISNNIEYHSKFRFDEQ